MTGEKEKREREKKKRKKSVFPPHILHSSARGIAASLSGWLTPLIFLCNPGENTKNNGSDFQLFFFFYFEVGVAGDLHRCTLRVCYQLHHSHSLSMNTQSSHLLSHTGGSIVRHCWNSAASQSRLTNSDFFFGHISPLFRHPILCGLVSFRHKHHIGLGYSCGNHSLV